MNYTYSLGLIALVALGALTFIYTAEPQASSPLTIGAVISKTGFAADYGDMAEKAATLAVEEINAKGGSVRFIVEDDETNPTKAVSAYRKLVDIDRADVVIGSIFDFTTQPLLPLAESEKKVLVVPAQPTIKGSFEMNDYTYSMMPPFETIIENLEPHIAGTPGILRYQSDFGKEIERVLTRIAADKGLPALTVQSYEKIGAGDFRTQILKLKTADVDVLFLDMLTPDVVVFKKQAAELGYAPRVITYSLYGAVEADAGNEARYAGDLWLDWQDTVSPEFKQKFENRYGIAPRRGAEASYKAVYAVVNGTYATDFTEAHTAREARVTVYQFVNGTFAPTY
jgi:branched-chain amino acid transport system substrate-binding protein